MLVVLQVLLGPFVDVKHPLVAGGLIDVSFQQLFYTQVSRLWITHLAHQALSCQLAARPVSGTFFSCVKRGRAVPCPGRRGKHAYCHRNFALHVVTAT